MEDFKKFLEEFNIKNKILNSDKKLATFHLSKIDYSNGFNKDIKKKMDISFNDFKELHDSINLENDYENAFFNLNTEVDYDNKIKGGRIILKIFNKKNNYTNNFSDNQILNKFLTEKEKNNISFIERGFFNMCMLLMIKNNLKNIFEFKNHEVLNYIKSFEGIVLQKDSNNIKLILYIDNDYDEKNIKKIINIFKIILHINNNITLRFCSFSKNPKNINSNKDLYY